MAVASEIDTFYTRAQRKWLGDTVFFQNYIASIPGYSPLYPCYNPRFEIGRQTFGISNGYIQSYSWVLNWIKRVENNSVAWTEPFQRSMSIEASKSPGITGMNFLFLSQINYWNFFVAKVTVKEGSSGIKGLQKKKEEVYKELWTIAYRDDSIEFPAVNFNFVCREQRWYKLAGLCERATNENSSSFALFSLQSLVEHKLTSLSEHVARILLQRFSKLYLSIDLKKDHAKISVKQYFLCVKIFSGTSKGKTSLKSVTILWKLTEVLKNFLRKFYDF